MSVGVMEDYKLRDLRASHTSVCPVKSLTFFFVGEEKRRTLKAWPRRKREEKKYGL
jgi:hypothetical protein